MFKKIDPKKKYAEMEKEVLAFWKEKRIFEKSVENRPEDKMYSFYDGPPFITGVPHYGTLLSSIVKDAVPRYWTMKGYRVERRWGWDCHGLPAENMVEKKLGLKNKKDIERIGVGKFNEACLRETSQIASEWESVIDRIGRWVEFKNAYKTMDQDYMESVWWAFAQLDKKGLIYEDVRVSLFCPRCSTPLSNFEIAMDNSYEMDSDPSVYVKMKVAGEENTFFLVWTTTPWTLLANVALAVGKDIEYVKVRLDNNLVGEALSETETPPLVKDDFSYYILAKEQYEYLFGHFTQKAVAVENIKGTDLVGMKYEPIFPHDIENGYRVIAGDFVTTEEGTGIVHIAPAFGEDDFRVRKPNGLPIIMNVDEEGQFLEGEWQGQKVWEANSEIVKWIKENGFLFKREQITHSYPHCHRCHTKLIYKAQSAWYVNVEKIKQDLLDKNESINWFPPFLKHGRFQKGIEGAPDWNISRDRYFGTAIPVWKCENCSERKIVGSLDEVRDQMGNPNKLFLVRHGQAKNNVERILVSNQNDTGCKMTELGREQIALVARELRGQKIDLIFSSPLERTRETAAIISQEVGAEVLFDERLREIETGSFAGRKWEEYLAIYPRLLNPGKTDENGIEGLEEIRERVADFLRELNEKYQGKNIVIVSHGGTLLALKGVIRDFDNEEILDDKMPRNGELKILYAQKLEIHRPQIDEVEFSCEKCGGKMKRIPQVFDSWIESGSMPFAQFHYPFENKEKFEKSFPTDFISEYIAQTRAWFYVLHVLAVGIFGKESFKNVVTTGTIAGNDGKKMSKSLGNYTLPDIVLEKYSADALRFYLISSPLLNAQNVSFSEKAIQDIQRKFLSTLWNSYSFFTLYAGVDNWEPKNMADMGVGSKNLLDRWIVSELQKLIEEVGANMQSYDLVKATRPFEVFVDNLSNWYIRRSRKRFWKSESDKDKDDAYHTLWFVLVEFSKVLAPFCPFVADEIFKNLTGRESVHLENFPVANEKMIDKELNQKMAQTRKIIELGLSLRAENRTKVRQPLSELVISNALEAEFLDLIRDEVNVKRVVVSKEPFPKEAKVKKDEVVSVLLNVELTPELKMEGLARELVRQIQQARKDAGYEVDDRIRVGYLGDESVFAHFGDLIAREVLATSLEKGKLDDFELERELEINQEKYQIFLKKNKT